MTLGNSIKKFSKTPERWSTSRKSKLKIVNFNNYEPLHIQRGEISVKQTRRVQGMGQE
jgi:hypothetical protein